MHVSVLHYHKSIVWALSLKLLTQLYWKGQCLYLWNKLSGAANVNSVKSYFTAELRAAHCFAQPLLALVSISQTHWWLTRLWTAPPLRAHSESKHDQEGLLLAFPHREDGCSGVHEWLVPWTPLHKFVPNWEVSLSMLLTLSISETQLFK